MDRERLVTCGEMAPSSTAIGSHLYPRVPSETVSAEIAAQYKEKLRKIGHPVA